MAWCPPPFLLLALREPPRLRPVRAGGFVRLNQDLSETDPPTTITGEDDLVEITLDYAPATLNVGTIALSSTSLGTKITLWDSATRDNQVTELCWSLSQQQSPPESLWVEGIGTSAAVRDIALKLSYDYGQPAWCAHCEDTVNATVWGVSSVESDRMSVCTGGVESAAHQATITATVTPVVEGRTVHFAITGNSLDEGITDNGSLSATEAVTDAQGHAQVTLTSGAYGSNDEPGGCEDPFEVTVAASAGDSPATGETTTVEYDPPTEDTAFLDPVTEDPIAYLPADGESQLLVRTTLTYGDSGDTILNC